MEKSEIKAKNLHDMAKEMLPFLLYAAVPIAITCAIAYILGNASQYVS